MAVTALHSNSNADPGVLPQHWATKADGIPVARYIDSGFAQLEARMLWPKVWQMACRLDQVRNVGDFFVYDILKESVIVVRVDENTVKAYHNVCPHRATALAIGTGRFDDNIITCPFHGWKWDLKGDNRFILDRGEFKDGCLTDEDVHLKELHCEVWAGFVCINLDKNAGPLSDFVAPIAKMIDELKIGEMKFHWHMQMKVPANWKVSLEAFMEAYHVPATHPQIVGDVDHHLSTAMFQYRCFENGHSVFNSDGATSMGRLPLDKLLAMSASAQTDALLRNLMMMQSGQDAQVQSEEVEIARSMRHREIPEGKTVGQHFQTVLREHYAAQGRPIGSFEAISACTDMAIFPNVVFLPLFGNCVMYRVRPIPENDPDWCIFDMYALRTYAESQPVPPWETQFVDTDKVADPEVMWLIPSQDFKAVPRQQKGMHSMAISQTRLSSRQEVFILNLHNEMDRYLKGDIA